MAAPTEALREEGPPLRWLPVALGALLGTLAAAEAVAAPEPAAPAEEGRQVAILAGGCYWGMQDILRKVPGVLETEVGYAGGQPPDPQRGDSFRRRSDYAEAVRVVFDPRRLSYPDLLERWFFRMHDPTTRDRQGNDVGRPYRSAIFFLDEAQRVAAEEVKARVDRSGRWKRPLVTEILPSTGWIRAAEKDQDYLVKNPAGYTCHYLRPG